MMAFHDHFSARAATYTRYRPDYPAELIAFVASLAPAHRVAWDCATGNGQAAVALADHFGRVIATDASAEQIAQAKPHDRVTYRVAPAESSGIDAASVDLVTVAQALHWFDRPAFYAEATRVLVPNGAIAVWSYGDPRMDDPAADAVLHRFNFETMGSYWPTNCGQVGAAYRDYEFPFEDVDAPTFTLAREWTLDQLAGYLRSWSAVAQYRKTHDDDPVDGFEREVRAVWPDASAPRRIVWPLTVRAGRARAVP